MFWTRNKPTGQARPRRRTLAADLTLWYGVPMSLLVFGICAAMYLSLKTALNGMHGLKYVRSTSLAGLNDIKCIFEYGTDYWEARQEVINRITFVDNLPAGVTPSLSPWSPTGEIVRYVLEGDRYTLNQLKAVQDWVLERALKTVPGVIDVTGFGGTVKQYQILVDPRLLRQYEVTMQQVEDAINRSNAAC